MTTTTSPRSRAPAPSQTPPPCPSAPAPIPPSYNHHRVRITPPAHLPKPPNDGVRSRPTGDAPRPIQRRGLAHVPVPSTRMSGDLPNEVVIPETMPATHVAAATSYDELWQLFR